MIVKLAEEPGGVIVNQMTCLVHHEDVYVLELDMGTKRPEILTYGGMGSKEDPFFVSLQVGEETTGPTNTEFETFPTTISFYDIFPKEKMESDEVRFCMDAWVAGYTLKILLTLTPYEC